MTEESSSTNNCNWCCEVSDNLAGFKIMCDKEVEVLGYWFLLFRYLVLLGRFLF